MCGIAGFTGAPDKGLLKAMTSQLIHRGPDDEGFYLEPGISLGMRRLSIIDLKTGQQPIHNEDKKLWVTCNGEIYNFQPLREELQKAGHRFYTHSDTEVLVHLYEVYGADFLAHLNGMFAIALWDSNQQTLLLARDRLGVKPLYYAEFEGEIYYGSEIKAILQQSRMPKEISFEALSHYLTFRAVPAPMTIYQNIFCLRPGEMLLRQNGKTVLKKYWSPDFSKQKPVSEERAIEQILDLLKDATRVRMISDVPVGAYLSGGVDSSLVVALMRELSNQNIKTFSLTYDEDLSHKSDFKYARMIAEKFGTEHHEYVMGAEELQKDLEKIVWHFDQPFNGVISTFFLSKLVQQHVKVALTGDGADDQFGSYAHHRLCWPIDSYLNAKRNGLPESAIDYGSFKGREDYVKAMAHEDLAEWRIKFYAFTDEEKRNILSDEVYDAVGPHRSLDLLKRNLKHTEGLDPLNRLLDVDVNTLLPDEILTFADRLSMAHSIELRSPFLDYRFIELVAAMPGTLKIKGDIPKYILKKAAGRYLPDEILYRPKEGFILPQDSWILGKLKNYVQEVLSEERLKSHGFFNAAGVQKLLNGYFNREHTNSYKIWNLIMFQLWYSTSFAPDTIRN